MKLAAPISTDYCTITQDAWESVRDTQGAYFEAVMGVDRAQFANDTLDPRRPLDMAAVLEEYVPLAGKKVLEIGAGCGVTHIVWRREFFIDGWGVEPEGEGFESSFQVARALIAANGLDPGRILDATGEALPFPDKTFDIVYSSNVLEHVNEPARVLREAVRVLKPGGTLQIVCPNYLSYFDGHYGALHPPIFSNAFFRGWIRWVYRKDPSFAATIRTEVNPVWAARQLAEIARTTPLVVHTLGQEKFLERMDKLEIGARMRMGLVIGLVRGAKRLRLNNLLARIIVALRGWTPLIITATRLR